MDCAQQRSVRDRRLGASACYRLAFIVDGICVLRYDNEVGKGDHRHIGKTEKRYNFTSPEVLLTDFWSDVDRWRR